jgi:hypothetical protein
MEGCCDKFRQAAVLQRSESVVSMQSFLLISSGTLEAALVLTKAGEALCRRLAQRSLLCLVFICER